MRHAILFVAALTACAPEDLEAPPAPDLDPLPEVTQMERLLATGIAEYGAKVQISREPAFAAGETAPAAASANLFTGRFKAELPLAAGADNVFTFVAVDDAGNRSPPAKVTVRRKARHAENLILTLDEPHIRAGDPLVARAQVVIDEPGVSRAGLSVTFSIGGGYPLSIEPQTVQTDALGRAVATFTGLTRTGLDRLSVPGTVTATATAAGADPVSEAVAFTVHSGPAATLAVELAEQSTDPLSPPGETIRVRPGADLSIVVTALDAHGNMADADILVSTDAPGTAVVGTRLTVPVRAGTYRVTASATGTVLGAQAVFIVVPGPAEEIELAVDPQLATAGDRITVWARAVDAYGNTTFDRVELTTNAPEGFLLTDFDRESGYAYGGIATETAGRWNVAGSAPGGLLARASLIVLPGEPVGVNVTATPNPVSAGLPLTLSARVYDTYDNDVSRPVSFAVSAPGASVVGGTVLGLFRAGSYTAYAQVGGTLVTGSTDFTVSAGAPHHIALALDKSETVAGSAVVATASVRDAHDNVTGDLVSLASDAGTDRAGTPQVFSGVSTTNGVTQGSLTVRSTAVQPVTVVASFAGLPAATAAFAVRPAPPAALSFDVPAKVGGYQAGDPVPFTYALLDSFQNPAGTPVMVTVSAPNVVVFNDGVGGGEIAGLVRAGTYTVSARAVGTNLPVQSEAVVIGPNPGEGFNLILSGAMVAEGTNFLATVLDAFGNPVDLSGVTFTFDANGLSRAGDTFTALRPGTYAIRACLTASPSVCDTEYVGVQSILDTVPPTVRVVVEYPDPAVKDANSETIVPLGSRVAFRIEASDDRGLSNISWVVTFGTSGSCTRQSATPILLTGGTTALDPPLSVSVTFPNCAQSLDPVTIVAMAEDEAGNRRNSGSQQDAQGRPVALRLGDRFGLTVEPGFVVTVEGRGGSLNSPIDVVRNGSGGPLVVSNNGNDRAILVFSDRSMADLRDDSGNRIDLDFKPTGVAIDRAGNLYFGLDDNSGNGRIARVTPNLTTMLSFMDSGDNLNDPVACVAIDEGSIAPDGSTLPALLCASIEATHRVVCANLSGEVQFTCNQTAAAGCGNTNAPGGSGARLARPLGIAFGPPENLAGAEGGYLYVLNNEAINSVAGRISVFRLNQARTAASFDRFIATGLSAGDGADLVYAPGTNNLIVSTWNTGKILRVPVNGGTPTKLVDGFRNLAGMAWDGNGLLVVDNAEPAVFRVMPGGANPGTF